MAETYSLLWSKKGNTFHVEPLERTAKSGMDFLHRDQTNDYLLVGFGSMDEMCERADELRPVLEKRSDVRKAEAIWPEMKIYQRPSKDTQ